MGVCGSDGCVWGGARQGIGFCASLSAQWTEDIAEGQWPVLSGPSSIQQNTEVTRRLQHT